MIVFGTQDFVDDIAIAGQQYQSVRILVQTANGKYALFVANKINNVSLDVTFGGAGNSHGFVQTNVNMFLLARADKFFVYAHFITIINRCAKFSAFAVYGYAAAADQFIGSAAGTQAGFADEFVEAHADQ